MTNYASRFPDFELSYETIAHKNVPANYNLGVMIPNGRKSFIWHTFNYDEDVVLLLDLDREKRVVKTSQIGTTHTSLALGTIVYGVVVPETRVFLIEDIYFYKGFGMKEMNAGERLHYIREYLETSALSHISLELKLPYMWWMDGVEPDMASVPYMTHHIQYRSLNQTVPFLNKTIERKPIIAERPTSKSAIVYTPVSNPDFSKPQYRYPTVFSVVADVQTDIYRLFAEGTVGSLPLNATRSYATQSQNPPSREQGVAGGRQPPAVYYNSAYIPNYKTSVFMNELFRNIRENRNIDNIEESDDETDFEDVREDKYVDLKKTMKIECVFHPKFKRWVPVRVADNSQRVIHIRMLTRDKK